MSTIGMYGEEPEQIEDVQALLRSGGYSLTEIIAAAVFGYEKVGANGLVNPAERLFLGGAVDAIMNHARVSPSQEEAVDTIEDEVTTLSPFQEFLTPEGRIRVCVESAAEIIRHRPELLTQVLQEIENGSGAWGQPEPSAYSHAVALGLRKLLK